MLPVKEIVGCTCEHNIRTSVSRIRALLGRGPLMKQKRSVLIYVLFVYLRMWVRAFLFGIINPTSPSLSCKCRYRSSSAYTFYDRYRYSLTVPIKFACLRFTIKTIMHYRPLAMRKDGIQTRKRKPKKPANGAKPNGETPKKDGHSSPAIDGNLVLLIGL